VSFREIGTPGRREDSCEAVAKFCMRDAKFCDHTAKSPARHPRGDSRASETSKKKFFCSTGSVSNRFARSWESRGFSGRDYLAITSRLPFNRVLSFSSSTFTSLGCNCSCTRVRQRASATMIHRAGSFSGRGRNFLPNGLTDISALSRAWRGR